MRRLIKGRAVVDDPWTLLREASSLADVPDGVPVIVPLALWLSRRAALHARGEVGVWLAPTDDPAALLPDIGTLPLIAVDFPKFTDGRGYSIARLLRDRYGFRRELRAIGDVLRDQLFQMVRCGFNAYATRQDRNIHDALKGLTVFSETYQASVDNPLPLFRRHERGALPELSDVGAGI